ncbi:hypothetical protein AOQ84DRAFT_434385 [Glonium stellatum]|uniref:F-box domain-containing protein n=1 Tax=Glonium stellatum TaxID=574774 RepID=A0A8E2EPB6_9PEZI|nr:hypothetical protein AOQ84DRAFT_434385 [Glonium stellatum]
MLMELAPELLENILSFLQPHGLVSFGSTCRMANAFIWPTNQVLWRSAFLQIFDDPHDAWKSLLPTARAANSDRETQWDWYCELRRRLLAFKVIREETANTIIDIFETTPSSGVHLRQTQQGASLNLDFLDRCLNSQSHGSIIHDFHRGIESLSMPLEGIPGLNRPLTRSMVPRQRVPESASRLHVFYGSTKREQGSNNAKASARGVVYDWAVTGPEADYGPFRKDKSGLINWQVLEAVSSLMIRNFETVKVDHLRTPTGFRYNLPNIIPKNSLPDDWAGVCNAWIGTYAFLDYRDLVHYNFAHQPGHPQGPGLDTYQEACGDLMQLQLKLDQDGKLKDDWRLRTTLPVCEDLPMLYFSGTSGGHRSRRPLIAVRGTVSLLPGGRQVRWRFLISYGGADQWQLEGVQPGGIRSGGIFGLWTHCDHEENAPVGPFCYFPLELYCKDHSYGA